MKDRFFKWYKEKMVTFGALSTAPNIYSNRMLLNARIFGSRGNAFVLSILGVISQTFHTAFLLYDYSSFDSISIRIFNAVIFSLFLSSALLYFTLKSDDTNAKYRNAVYYFAIFDVFVNIFYYFMKLVWVAGNISGQFVWGDVLFVQFIIALPFSFMLPFAMKMYGGEIRVMDNLDKVIDYTSEVTLDTYRSETFKLTIENEAKRLFKEFQETFKLDSQTREKSIKETVRRYIRFISNKTNKSNIFILVTTLNTTLLNLVKYTISVNTKDEKMKERITQTNEKIVTFISDFKDTQSDNILDFTKNITNEINTILVDLSQTIDTVHKADESIKGETFNTILLEINDLKQGLENCVKMGADVVMTLEKDGKIMTSKTTFNKINN